MRMDATNGPTMFCQPHPDIPMSESLDTAALDGFDILGGDLPDWFDDDEDTASFDDTPAPYSPTVVSNTYMDASANSKENVFTEERPQAEYPSACSYDGLYQSISMAERVSSGVSVSPTALHQQQPQLGMDDAAVLHLEPTPIHPYHRLNMVNPSDFKLMNHQEPSVAQTPDLRASLSDVFGASVVNQQQPASSLPPLKKSNTVGVPSSIMFPPPLRKSGGNSKIARAVSSEATLTSSTSVTDRWNERYQDLKTFVQKHGHAHVPINYQDNLALSKWAKRQRYQWKLKQDNKQSSMTDERQALLEDLGFLWDVRHSIWDSRYRELVRFHKLHGHCNVGIRNELFPKLGTWVKCQRRQYQLMVSGQRSHMTPQRVQQLNDLDFLWKGKQPQQFTLAKKDD